MKKLLFTLVLTMTFQCAFTQEVTRTFKIKKKYLNFPVDHDLDERQMMRYKMDGNELTYAQIKLADDEPDYWVFKDMTKYKGKEIEITFDKKVSGIEKIFQSERFEGEDKLYKEKYRPQFHFSPRRGWNNDPNGLCYYDGEYHMFFQHNPYEANWQNMTWGHMVSTDLVHWEELDDALFPDELGTMFSGTGAIDHNNTSGFQTGTEKPIIAAYTAHLQDDGSGTARQTQCIAYSNDRGRTFTKYEGNPVIDSKDTWKSSNTRDPKIFWHDESNKWVMVLFEKDGHSFYNSDNLKDWTYLSHLVGFWECPELFELPVDGNKYNSKWAIYGASGTYMIGDFDGREFHVESGKHQYVNGQLYAAQTFNDIPESDGRRIQFGWGLGIDHGGKMPFTQLMLFPTQLTLRSTRNGIRMFNEPIAEIKKLHKKSHRWSDLTREEANEKLKLVQGHLFHIKTQVEIIDRTSFQLNFNGNTIAKYDMNYNRLNGAFYEGADAESRKINLEILVDRTSVEIFADGGKFTVVESLSAAKDDSGLKFGTPRGLFHVNHLEVHELKSIW